VTPLASTDWLAAEIGAADLRVVDVRWYLNPKRSGRAEYLRRHIPGAVFLDIDRDLSAPGGGLGKAVGRHPWPSAEQVSAVMSAAGIGPRTRVVAYDGDYGSTAARLWYVLRAHGHDAASVLDGGLVKWDSEGRPVESGEVTVAPQTFVARLRPGWVVDKAGMIGRGPETIVLDARAGERYRGESEPIDPRAGHIPGALSAPFLGNLTGEGTWEPLRVFRSPAELRDRYAALEADRGDTIVYCGSGVTACHDLLALHVAGLRGRLYAGSWSEWSSDPSLPIATGSEP
jgi:thiosulfate/3-mercaptopyruvate sulfurtransferase